MRTLLNDGLFRDQPLKEKRDIKLFILYLAYNIKYPMEYDEANDIAVQDGIINPLQFAECFSELLEAGTMAEDKQPDGISYFYITERGVHVVAQLQNRLSAGLRKRALRNAMRRLSFKKRNTELKYDVLKREDGSFTLQCSIIEESGPLLELMLMVPTKQEADRMLYNLNDRPEDIYREILAILSKPR